MHQSVEGQVAIDIVDAARRFDDSHEQLALVEAIAAQVGESVAP